MALSFDGLRSFAYAYEAVRPYEARGPAVLQGTIDALSATDFAAFVAAVEVVPANGAYVNPSLSAPASATCRMLERFAPFASSYVNNGKTTHGTPDQALTATIARMHDDEFTVLTDAIAVRVTRETPEE